MMHYQGSPCPHPQPTADTPAIVVQQLVAGYQQTVLHGVSLRIARGTRVALVGANGAGKSTLLKVIAGLLPARSGSVEIFGRPQRRCPHCLAYLPQRSHIDWQFPVSVRRLVMAGRYVHLGWLQRPSQQDEQLVMQALTQLGIAALADSQIAQLSGGQQQRALLARALVQQADILLLDEPLNAVDQATRQIMHALLDSLRQQGKTVVMATHDLGRLDDDFDDAIFLAEGVQIAPPPAMPAARTRACNS